MKFSVIIPAKGYLDSFSLILKALVKQRMLIHELIIIDSSSNNKIKSLCTDFSTRININYIKGDYYPGEARNHGVLQAKSELIAFLDSKTIPKNDWLSNAKSTLDQNVKCIFGYTTYRAETGFQEILQASIVQCPELCGLGAISLTKILSSFNTNISTAIIPTIFNSLAIFLAAFFALKLHFFDI